MYTLKSYFYIYVSYISFKFTAEQYSRQDNFEICLLQNYSYY